MFSQVVDIAKQMIQTKPGNATDVIFGGGYLAFNAVGKPENKWDCMRKDGLNLIQQWKNQHISRSQSFTSLIPDLHQDINIVSSFSRCLNGTFP